MSTSVTYKGAEIAALENETKTLNTAGKWVEDDITIEDVTGGGANLQSKSVQYVPSGASQSATVVPDSGYDGLSQVSVTVDPVPEGKFDIDIANAGFYDDAGVRKWHARASFDAWDGWIPPDSYYGPYRERNAVPAGTVITPSSTAQTVGGANWVMEGPVTIEAASGGGGATNYVEGTFTPTTPGAVFDVSVPYTGSGYPVSLVIAPAVGAYNSAGGNFYSLVKRYAIGTYCMYKARATSAPAYNTASSVVSDSGVVIINYKSSTSSASSYAAAHSESRRIYTTAVNPSTTNTDTVKIRSSTQFSVMTANTSYGFVAGVEYAYHIMYSE